MSNPSPEKAGFFYDKKILVTGGTGSIGQSIVAQLLQYNPQQVIVFSKDDSKQYLMRQTFSQSDQLSFFLGDIRDYEKIEWITRGVDIIFHTAALKQVPVCEENPFETIQINLLGCQNIIRAAITNDVSQVVNLSTDKAVRPTSVMGMTKRLAEQLFYQADRTAGHRTRFCSVRFGNVLGSRGSVIPLWIQQIKAGQPITLTHPAMTRFFMTIDQAVQLTLKAAQYSQGGETFIFKMKSLSLDRLIKTICHYARLRGWPVPEIKLIGARPGEKFYEELLYPEESRRLVEDHELYVLLPPEQRPPYYHFQPSRLKEYRSDRSPRYSTVEILSLIKQYEDETVRDR